MTGLTFAEKALRACRAWEEGLVTQDELRARLAVLMAEERQRMHVRTICTRRR